MKRFTRMLPKVSIDSGLGQVVLNLMLNAIQAIESNGTIFLHLENQNDIVVFRIRDTGPGIPEGIRDEVFEPFFTTKPSSGTGLGLGIVKRLVNLYGGQITIESTIGQGTRAEITFPGVENESIQ